MAEDSLFSVQVEISFHSFLAENPFKDVVDLNSIFRNRAIQVFSGSKRNSNEIFVASRVSLAERDMLAIERRKSSGKALFTDSNQRDFKVLFCLDSEEAVEDMIRFFESKAKYLVDVGYRQTGREMILLPSVEKFLDDVVMAEWLIGDLLDLLEACAKNMLNFCDSQKILEWLLDLQKHTSSCLSNDDMIVVDLAITYLPRVKEVLRRYVKERNLCPGNHGSLNKV